VIPAPIIATSYTVIPSCFSLAFVAF